MNYGVQRARRRKMTIQFIMIFFVDDLIHFCLRRVLAVVIVKQTSAPNDYDKVLVFQCYRPNSQDVGMY